MFATLEEVIVFIERELPERVSLPALLRKLCRPDDEDSARVPNAVATLEDSLAFLRAIRKPRDLVMFRLFCSGCLEPGQVLTLPVVGMDVRNRRVFVGTGPDDRYAPLDPKTGELLEAWNWERPLDEVRFGMTGGGLFRCFQKWARATGLKQKYEKLGMRFAPTSLRAGMAKESFARGMAWPILELMMGTGYNVTLQNMIAPRGLPMRAARYRAALNGGGGHLGVGERRHITREKRPPVTDTVPREEVVEYLRAHLPATAALTDIIEALCTLRLQTMPKDEREWVREMGDELPLRSHLVGARLPYAPSVAETLALCEGLPVVRFLYRSGIREEEREGVRDVDPETGIVRLEGREVVVDLETAALVAAHPEVLTMSGEEVRELVGAAAARTGLAARFKALGRKFGLECLRHAYATHLLEGGLDFDTLHGFLGNEFEETTERYLRIAVGRWRAEYVRCHPLARGLAD